MKGNDVRIEQENHRQARIYIGGKEVKGVRYINYKIGVDDIPIVTIEFIPETLNIDKDLKVQVSLDSEKFTEIISERIEKLIEEKGVTL